MKGTSPRGSAPTRKALGLFEHLQDVCYFAKDRSGRFIAANEALVLMLGYNEEGELLGKTDYDLVPSYLAHAYLKDDAAVMEEGRSIVNKIELVTRNDLSVYWYTTTKIPLYGHDGTVIGLEGTTRAFKSASSALGPFPALFRAIDFIENNFSDRITVAEMAQQVGVGVRTFERQFKKRFGLTPISYLKKVRINAACRDLIQSGHSIAKIAMDCGFSDQSHLTKEFARLMRATPQVYRDTHSPGWHKS